MLLSNTRGRRKKMIKYPKTEFGWDHNLREKSYVFGTCITLFPNNLVGQLRQKKTFEEFNNRMQLDRLKSSSGVCKK